MTDDRKQGVYAEWEWDVVWQSYLYNTPHRIYPASDGKFSVSSAGCWHSGIFDTFEAAERDVLGISDSTDDKDAKIKRLREAAQGVIDNWLINSPIEELKEYQGHEYWSPQSASIESQFINKLRAALKGGY